MKECDNVVDLLSYIVPYSRQSSRDKLWLMWFNFLCEKSLERIGKTQASRVSYSTHYIRAFVANILARIRRISTIYNQEDLTSRKKTSQVGSSLIIAGWFCMEVREFGKGNIKSAFCNP
jgi:hypothetical protein